MSKLTVVYLKDAGHVLAALTRADPPQQAEPASALVGIGLPVRFIDNLPADVTLPAQDLATVTVDDQPEVVVGPQGFQVVQDSQGQPQVTNVGAASHVTLAIDTSAGATVTLSNATLPAMVVLQKVASPSLPPTIVSPVTVGPGGTVVLGKAGFTTGQKWNMYLFVQGLQPVAQQITI